MLLTDWTKRDKEFLDSITPEVLENVKGTLQVKDDAPPAEA